jgi:hypothetical protein
MASCRHRCGYDEKKSGPCCHHREYWVIAAAWVRSFTFHITPSAGPPASAGPPGTGSTSTGERRAATPDTPSLAAARPRPRERHARIISADGEYQASKKLAQAAAVMAAGAQDTPAPPLPVPEIPALPVPGSAAVTAPLNAAPKHQQPPRRSAHRRAVPACWWPVRLRHAGRNLEAADAVLICRNGAVPAARGVA